ncbi:MAG: hypothetical protein AAF756_22775 [Pseudomonadota bacterium]
MQRPFENSEEFQSEFEFGEESDSSFYDPVVLSDRKVGFSIKRRYPRDIRYKPPNNQNGKPDKVAVLWVNYDHPDEIEAGGADFETTNRARVTVRISTFSIYLNNHFDYDDTDQDSPLSDEVAASNRTPEPIGLEFMEDFYYDHQEGRFRDTKDRRYTGNELLDHVFRAHCETVHLWKGMGLRLKLALRGGTIGLLTLLADVLIAVLDRLFGRSLETDDRFGNYYRGYAPESFKRLNENTIDISGYRASRSTVVLFCCLVLVVGMVRYSGGHTGGFLSYIAQSNLMAISSTIVALWLLDVIVPRIVVSILNTVIKLRTFFVFKRFRFK